MWPFCLGWLALIAIPLFAQGQECKLDERGANEARSLVAAQVSAELSLYQTDWPDLLERRYVELTLISSYPRCGLFRASVMSIFHAPGYSVLIVDSIAIPAGGFAERGLVLAASWLKVRGIERRAEELALAAEYRYGRPVLLPSSSDGIQDSISVRWRSARPPGWPEPGTKKLGGGATMVRLTALRPHARKAGQRFTAIGYAFVFSSDSTLIAVATREGAPF